MIYISSLKNTLSRVNMLHATEEDILQAELFQLFETELKEKGYYISPVIVGEASSGVKGIIHLYNSFTTPKTFSLELTPGSTSNFSYDSFEFLSTSPETIGSGESSGMLFILQRTDSALFSQRFRTVQYTVQIFADDELIGKENLEVIILNS